VRPWLLAQAATIRIVAHTAMGASRCAISVISP